MCLADASADGLREEAASRALPAPRRELRESAGGRVAPAAPGGEQRVAAEQREADSRASILTLSGP